MDDLTALRGLYDREVRQREQAGDPAYRLERDGPVLRLVGPGSRAHENAVVWADLDERTAGAAIARQVAFFAGLGRAFEWKLYEHDRPGDLAARLQAAGLEAGAEETLVALEVARAPGLARALPAGVTLRRLVDPGALEPLVALNAAVYGDPGEARWLIESLQAELRACPGALRVWAAFAGQEAISAGWARFPGGSAFGSLWGGATRAEWRARGVYSALVAARIEDARELGRAWLAVDCSPHSLPILRRRGFRPVARTTPWVWCPAAG